MDSIQILKSDYENVCREYNNSYKFLLEWFKDFKKAR